MKIAGVVAAALLAGASVAQAQTAPAAGAAACTQMKQLLASTHAQVKAMQGAVKSAKSDETEFVSKLQLEGFSNCTLTSAKGRDDINKYFEHNLSCSREMPASEAANVAVEAMWSCTKDLFTERKATEALIGGRYRIIGVDGDVPVAGRASGAVSFGDTEFARLLIEKRYADSEEYDVNIYWSFTK